MSRPISYDFRLRNAAIDSVMSEALILAGFQPLVAHPLGTVLAAAGLEQAGSAAALEAWTADRLLADPATRAALHRLALRGGPKPLRRGHPPSGGAGRAKVASLSAGL